MGFTNDEIQTLVVFERLGGSLSLVSVTLVFIAYAVFPRLRTVPNTFIVFASIANVGASVGSIIAYDGLFQGESSGLCQAQGFMFEFFIQSDPWWALAMAINVLLIFFTKIKPSTIRKRGWLYCLICYGGPFIIALICLRLREPGKSMVYGNAGLWCWITSDWGPLRIYSYYMLIWICILVSMIIYIGVGTYVFRVRNRLNQVWSQAGDYKNVRGMVSYSMPETGRSKASTGPLSSFSEQVEGTVNITTEVQVHIEDTCPEHSPSMEICRPQAAHLRQPLTDTRVSSASGPGGVETTILSHPLEHDLEMPRDKRRCSSATARMVGLFDNFVVVDPVKRAYLRTSLLFGISVLVTWIPSSINRIHGLISNDSPYAYNLATATVLPLQGVWNGIIFFVTSWRVFKECLREGRRPAAGVMELGSRSSGVIVTGRRRNGSNDEEKFIGMLQRGETNRAGDWDETDTIVRVGMVGEDEGSNRMRHTLTEE